MLVALAVAIPFLLLSAGIVWQLADNERENRRDAILYSSRTLLNAVDALLSKHIAVAQTLATSPALQVDDLEAFRKEAERALPALSGGWMVLSDESGQQLINLARPPGTPLPRRNPIAIEAMKRAFETKQTQVSNVLIGPVVPNPIVTVEVPVFRQDKPPLSLAVIMETKIFLPLFAESQLPDGWFAGLIDRDGKFIARSRDHDRMVGQPASEGFREAAKSSKDGWNEMVSSEGSAIATGHATSTLSGWVMGLAAETEVFYEPIRNTIIIASAAGGIAILLTLLLALWAARQIAGPIQQIEQGTHALVRRESVAFRTTGLPEVDRALDAFTETAKTLEQHERERDEREAHVHVIMRELSHRSKNLLAIVLAIARQTARNTQDFQEFEGRFSSRIQALADAHDLLVEQQWNGAQVDALVRGQLSAFGMERVILNGEPVMLRAEAVQNVALALHELATNASKYGALSVPDGRVTIEWVLNPGETGERSLRLTWRESDGPPVKAPERKGFGCFVLERVTVNALGEGGLEFNEKGLIWTCVINPEHIVGTRKPESPPRRRVTDQPIARRAS
ncbi:sensor histidine kinase [Leptospira sp. severe_002]|uniref:sensor histidine kinase n=1 Tax=Leptospira sp. severe_002 TaxID=2838237 RepID=UPI001E4DEB8D|nr:sensor histidine kinase [Leptospira sp. severe_002]